MSQTLTFDDAYFSDAVLRLHINAAITIILDVFVAYLVIYKSPKSMGTYRYYLLNIVISALLLDLHLAFIFVPVPLFPAIGMCSEGLTKGFGRTFGGEIHMPIYVLLYGVSTCAVLLAFAYRYFLLKSHASVLKTRKGIIMTGVAYFIYTIPTSIMFLLVSNAHGAEVMKARYPKIYKIYEERICFTGDTQDPLFAASLGLTLALIFLSFLIATILAVKIYNVLRSQKQAMSEKTFKMHQKMLMSLIVQIVVPSFSLIFPTATMIILLFKESEDARWVNPFIFQIGSTHSILNCLMLIILIKPYRMACLKIVFCGSTRLMERIANIPGHTSSNPVKVLSVQLPSNHSSVRISTHS